MASTADGAVPVDSDHVRHRTAVTIRRCPNRWRSCRTRWASTWTRSVRFSSRWTFPVELSAARSSDEARARRAQRLSTTKLWPDLGELLNQDDPEG
jgi:hypothetical protein